MIVQAQNPHEVWALCKSAADRIYRKQPLNSTPIAHLLFGTAAQESHFIFRRQIGKSGKPLKGTLGGHGLWQVEFGSVDDSLDLLSSDPDLAARVDAFLMDSMPGDTPIFGYTAREVLDAMTRNDRVGCAFARLHYLRVRSVIPGGTAEQAGYWKKHYNTELGKGTIQEYLQNWRLRCVPVLQEKKS